MEAELWSKLKRLISIEREIFFLEINTSANFRSSGGHKLRLFSIRLVCRLRRRSEGVGDAFVFDIDHLMIIWFQREVVFAWLNRWMQVKARGAFSTIILSSGFEVKSYLHGRVVGYS